MPNAEGMVATAPLTFTFPGARTLLLSFVAAFAGFITTAAVIHAAIPDPLKLHAAVRSEKLVMLDLWHGKVFSAAFGSSHVHNGFDPRIFDATLANSPVATRSANLAIEGGSQTEQYVMAQQFVERLVSPAQAGASPQPCLVILELGAGTNFPNDHLVDARAINIYDWRTTKLVTRYVSAQMGPVQRYGRLGFALLAMGMHYASVGMLSSEIFAPPLDDAVMNGQTADDRRGQLVMPYHPSYLPDLYGMARQIAKKPVRSPGEILPGNAELIERLAASSAVPNVSFVYVEMPRLDGFGAVAEYPDSMSVKGPHGPIVVPIINLGRVDQYPALFNPELWYDGSHFNGTGAQLATRILAEQLKKWYATSSGPTPCG